MTDILDRWLSTARTADFILVVALIFAASCTYAWCVAQIVKWQVFSRKVRLDSERLRVVGYAPERGER